MFRSLKTAALTSLLGLVANGALADVTVEFWHSFKGARGEIIEEIAQAFEAANPGINIEHQHIGNYNDIMTKMQAAIPAGREPAAVLLEVTRYGLFADRGILTDLTGYLDADPLKDELFDFAREVGAYEGKNYIIPFNSSTPLLYVNKALFAEAGMEDIPELKSFDDVLAAAKTVQEELGDQGVFGIAAPGQFARWGPIMSNDSDLIDSKTGEILIDAPNTVETYEWMASLVSEHEVASVDGVTKEKMARDAFFAGQVGMMFWSTGSYRKAMESLGEDLLVLPMPCNKTCATPIGGAGIGILESADQEVKDAAYKFVSFAANAQSNAKWFVGSGYMPINRNAPAEPIAAEALASEPGISVAINQLDIARGRPRPPVVTWMRSNEYGMWEAMALGQRGVQETLADFAEKTRNEALRTQ